MDKTDKGLWLYDKAIPGGKYLVLRRDGTVFPEPNFVLGAAIRLHLRRLRHTPRSASGLASEIRSIVRRSCAWQRTCDWHGWSEGTATQGKAPTGRTIPL
jgi:hypothetical protein